MYYYVVDHNLKQYFDILLWMLEIEYHKNYYSFLATHKKLFANLCYQ